MSQLPSLIEGRTIEPTAIANARLFTRLDSPDASLNEIEAVVRNDPSLAHRLLKVAADGSSNGLARRVRSLREAITLVGWRKLKDWVMLLSLSDPIDSFEAQFNSALLRAKLCESLTLLLLLQSA
ncbi:HDOD domain-containing protein [Acidithrix sp. C25]|uniref:HDOD domain-containing protein n=1 Tax=Acidithrix sp. C25 TaxID=1671482 RepID=UPI00191BA673|nr:HDOD domain-containing protein [Acidithrix sp. C25]